MRCLARAQVDRYKYITKSFYGKELVTNMYVGVKEKFVGVHARSIARIRPCLTLKPPRVLTAIDTHSVALLICIAFLPVFISASYTRFRMPPSSPPQSNTFSSNIQSFSYSTIYNWLGILFSRSYIVCITKTKKSCYRTFLYY